MQSLHVMIGIPGSGKSTVARYLAASTGAHLIETDAVRRRVHGRPHWPEREREVWQVAHADLIAHLEMGSDVVFDSTMCNKRRRRELISMCRFGRDLRVIGHYVATPMMRALRRNEHRDHPVPADVIVRMSDQLEADPPRTGDGFDCLLLVPGYHEAPVRVPQFS